MGEKYSCRNKVGLTFFQKGGISFIQERAIIILHDGKINISQGNLGLIISQMKGGLIPVILAFLRDASKSMKYSLFMRSEAVYATPVARQMSAS